MNGVTERLVVGIVRHARTLPISEAVEFLHDFLMHGESEPALDLIRQVYIDLFHSDRQLELIASGQLRLSISAPETQPPTTTPPQS